MQLEVAGLRHNESKKEKKTRSFDQRDSKRRLAPGRITSGLEVAVLHAMLYHCGCKYNT
ncbi:hypothetical protein X777_04387 [Ooceraea biroi]|uniref:Uncharacterized protein n=1 Tax=Ooceraea biroi TaxID=2015173 RepID=A0A026WID7_OOCBI|nr:hypothetical protein X777_04387 [Ooceraea biroi]